MATKEGNPCLGRGHFLRLNVNESFLKSSRDCDKKATQDFENTLAWVQTALSSAICISSHLQATNVFLYEMVTYECHMYGNASS